MQLEITEGERNLVLALLRTVNLSNPNEVIKLALGLKEKLEEPVKTI